MQRSNTRRSLPLHTPRHHDMHARGIIVYIRIYLVLFLYAYFLHHFPHFLSIVFYTCLHSGWACVHAGADLGGVRGLQPPQIILSSPTQLQLGIVIAASSL